MKFINESCEHSEFLINIPLSGPFTAAALFFIFISFCLPEFLQSVGSPLNRNEKNKGKTMIEDGKKVRIHYTGTLRDGEQFDSSAGRDPLEFEIGAGRVIPGFDAAVRDMEIGGKKTVTIPSSEAYGEVREEMIGDIPKDRFPAEMELTVGMPLQMQGPQGPLPVIVKEIKEDAVTIDANHPLAGKDLTFDLELVEIV
jgi:peptidylprolyl isomerase